MSYDPTLEHDLVNAFVAASDDLAGQASNEVVDAAIHFLAIAAFAKLRQGGLSRDARRCVAKSIQRDVHSVVAHALGKRQRPKLVPPEPPYSA